MSRPIDNVGAAGAMLDLPADHPMARAAAGGEIEETRETELSESSMILPCR